MKKEVKGFITGVLFTSILLFGIPAFADSILQSINVSLNSVKIMLNGQALSVDNLLYNGKTYVQLTGFCDVLEKAAKWDGKTRTVNITDKNVNNTPIPKPESNTSTNSNGIKPAILSVNSLEGGNKVEVSFSKKMDKSTAENISNYSFAFAYGNKANVPILSATLDSTGTKVVLQTAGQQAATLYEITISNVKDNTDIIMDKYTTKIIGNKSDDPSTSISGDPIILESVSTESDVSVKLTFNRKLDEISAQDIANYSVYQKYGTKTPLTVIKAELLSDQKIVQLTFSEPAKSAILYEVKVSNVKDIYGNTTDATCKAFVISNN